MFAKTIIDSDAFLDMSLSSQALYFHLSMRADDDGFLNNAKKIMRVIGANQNDYDLLIAKRFIIQFDDGVCVIKHWRIHNYIQNDRYKPTMYQNEMAMLKIKNNKAYTLMNNDTKDTNDKCIQDGYMLETQISIDKNSTDKASTDKTNSAKAVTIYYPNDSLLDKTLKDFIEFRKKIKKPMTERAIELLIAKLNKMTSDNDIKIEILNQSIMNSWQGLFPLKEDNTSKRKPNNTRETPEQYAKRMEEWADERERVCDDIFGN